jgi:hypothetical protein
MKKITIITMVSALSCSTLAQAGDMGDMGSMCINSFAAIEVGYSKTTIDGFSVNFPNSTLILAPTSSTKGESLRLSAGVLNKVYDQMGISAELGYGYYGRTSANTNEANTVTYFSNGYSISGLDALVGVAYVQPSFNLFFKLGAMIENLSYTSNAYILPTDGSPLITFSNASNTTEALPEIKIGGTYNFNDNWGLTLSYFHVFGSTVESSATLNADGDLINAINNSQNPSLNTVLVGLQYSFN